MEMVQVKKVQHSGQSSLVEWTDDRGDKKRVFIPTALIKSGHVLREELEFGIEYSAGFDELLKDTEFSQKADCIAKTLQQGGVNDMKSLQNAPRIVGHICGEDIYQIVAALNGAFAKGA